MTSESPLTLALTSINIYLSPLYAQNISDDHPALKHLHVPYETSLATGEDDETNPYSMCEAC